jgi:hypothetical protein
MKNLTKELQSSAQKNIDPIFEELFEQHLAINSNRIMRSIAFNQINRSEFAYSTKSTKIIK